jgi:hypothetical protein
MACAFEVARSPVNTMNNDNKSSTVILKRIAGGAHIYLLFDDKPENLNEEV